MLTVASLLLVGGLAGDAGAEPHEIAVDQDGTDIEITVDESAFGDADAEIDVEVNDVRIAENEPADDPDDPQDGEYVFTVGYADEFSDDDDLSEANVTVTTPEMEATEEHDLRYVEPEPGEWIVMEASGNVKINAATVVGISDGWEVTASAGDEEETVTLEPNGDSDIVLNRTDQGVQQLLLTNDNIGLLGETITVQEDEAVDFTAETMDGTITLEHPFLFDEEEYVVSVTGGSDGDPVYWTTRATADDGTLRTSLGAPIDDDATVRVVHDSGFERETAVDPSDETHEAELLHDGETVILDDAGLDGGENDTLTAHIRFSGEEETIEINEVPYEDGEIKFGEAGYELANASYDLLFVPDDEPVVAELAGGPDDPGVTTVSDDGMFATLTSYVPPGLFGVWGLVIAGLALLAGGLAVYVTRGSDGAGGAASSIEVQTKIVDERTGEVVDTTQRVKFVPTRSTAGQQDIITKQISGQAPVRLPYETYRARLTKGQVSARVRPDSETVVLELPPNERKVRVRDESSTPIANASVTVSGPNETVAGGTTDQDGTFEFEVPSSLHESDCTLTVEADRYQRKSGSLVPEVTLLPQTGNAEVVTSIDGTTAPDIDVRLMPDDEFTRRHVDDKSGDTAEDGTVRFEELPVGAYTATLNLDGEGVVEAEPVDVTVRRDESVSERIDATFTFAIDDERKERIRNLHRNISDLTPSNRDGAIPYYFGSVLTTVLTTVEEEFPNRGVTFLRNDADPVAVTDAVLDAVDDAVAYTRTAMTQKETVDLFSACSGLREVRITWDQDVEADRLIEFACDSKANHRRALIDHLEETDELIREKRSEVSTISPVRDLHGEIQSHATALSGTDSATQRAHFFVGLQMLDALEQLFDEREIVDRLEETVF
ncbi:hypothetical protein JCM17823_07130 [Halorubrum gandharaense]